MKYWAFLSYSHTDKKWGDWLHKALETYRVPRRIVGKESRDGKVPERVYPIFRDREELPVSADLGSNINEALKESRYLIVICSPRSAQSRWVGEEIKTFKKLGREDRILALIVDGEPNASEGKPGFKVGDECFHEAMRYRMVDGEPSEIRSEPIAADAREVGDGKTNAKLKLLAGLLGVNYDDLKQREQERRLRRARLVVTASLALIGIFAAMSVALFFKEREATHARDEATRSRDEATRSRDEARATLSRSDFLQALRSIDEGKDFDALALLARSLRSDPKNQSALCRLAILLMYQNHAIPGLRLKGTTWIRSAEFSPDGKRIVTASDDGGAIVWDSETGKPITMPMKHTGWATSARFSPDGKRILTASLWDQTARIWDAETGAPLSEPMRAGDVRSAQFSPDGKRVVTASGRDKRAQIWDAESGRPMIELRHVPAQSRNFLLGWVLSAEFSPDGKRVVTASNDNTARIWDAETGTMLAEPLKHDAVVTSVQFSPDGKRIVTASEDHTARMWDAETGNPSIQPMLHERGVNSARYSPDGGRIVTASDDSMVRVWDASTGRPLIEAMKHGAKVTLAQFSPNGKWIVTVSTDKTARIWDVEPAKARGQRIGGEDGVIASARFSPDGKRIATASHDGVVRIWDAATGIALTEPMRDVASVQFAEFSPDGRWVVSASRNTASVWDARTGKLLGHQMRHSNRIVSAQFSPDGKRLVTASDDNTARVWDVKTGQPVTEPIRHDKAVRSARFSPDGTKVVTASEDRTARLWDAATGRPLTEPMKHNHDVLSAEFSPDGKMVVTASSDNTARVWNAQTAEPLTEPIKHSIDVNFAQFSPDSKRIVTVSGQLMGARSQGEARIWDAHSGTPLTEPMEHDGCKVLSAEFSPDGKLIVTASVNVNASQPSAVSIWDAQTGRLLIRLKEPSWTSARFSPDGKRIVVTSGENIAQIYDIEPEGQIAPEWLPRLLEAIGGEHLNNYGLFEQLSEDSAQVLTEIKKQLNRESSNDDWVVLGRWFLADRSTRTVSPFSKITVPEYIENRIKENTRESLDEAEELAIGNPELLQRIKSAKGALSSVSPR